MTKKDYELLASVLKTDYEIYKNNRDGYRKLNEQGKDKTFQRLEIHNEIRMSAIITLAVALEGVLSKENPLFNHKKWNDYIFSN